MNRLIALCRAAATKPVAIWDRLATSGLVLRTVDLEIVSRRPAGPI
ncbi:hypothetical protein [Streptomyces virginiae]